MKSIVVITVLALGIVAESSLGGIDYCSCTKTTSTCRTHALDSLGTCAAREKPCEICRCDESGTEMCEVVASSSMDSSCSKVDTLVTRSVPQSQCMMNKVVVEIEGQRMGCLDPVPMTQDIKKAYGYGSDEAQNKDWLQGLENQFISLRFLHSTSTSTMSLCILYGEGKWEVPSMNSSSRVDITNSYGLSWEIQDDPFDTYSPPNIGNFSTKMWAYNAWTAHRTDGLCVGPITDNGENVFLRFWYLHNIKGVILNTFDAQSNKIEELNRWHLKDAAGRDPSQFNATTGLSLNKYEEIKSIRFKSACTCNV